MLDVAPLQETSGRILLAEDQPVNQRVATAMLENLGFLVDIAADGAGAVRAAILTRYRAILMDCQIPVLDGYRATGEIRRRQGASSRTPIIALTGSATPADRERCLAAGMDDYLTKPLSVKALAATLARWAPGDRSQTVPFARSRPSRRTASTLPPPIPTPRCWMRGSSAGWSAWGRRRGRISWVS